MNRWAEWAILNRERRQDERREGNKKRFSMRHFKYYVHSRYKLFGIIKLNPD